MALSAGLTEALQIASSKLNSHADGELVLSERKRVWRSVGPRLVEGNRAVKGIGLIRRTKLAALCVEKALGIWQEVWPDKDGPQQMLVTAERYLSDSIDFDSAWNRMNSFWGELEALLCE